MNTDSLFTSYGRTIAVGFGILLVLSVLGGVTQTSRASSFDGSAPPTGDGPVSTQEGENNTTNVSISIVRAMETAGNETNGTSIGAELTRKGNVTELERPTRVFEVEVLHDNGTVFVVDVNATDGSVRRVQTTENETGFFENLFGDDEVTEGDVNLSAIRSGSEAAELVENETAPNETIVGVELTSHDGTLVYDVEVVTEEVARTSVLVAAKPTEGGILSNETTDGNGEQRLW